MKRILVAVLMIMVFSTTAGAEGMMAGPKAGFNMFKAYGDDVPDEAEWYYGGAFGAFLSFGVREMIALQPEVVYSMKGWKVGDESLKLGYIDIPVLVKVMLPTEGALDPSIFIGPSIGFLLSAKAEDVDVKDDFKSTDFGLVVGGGIDYQLSDTGALLFDVRYSMGLTEVIDADESVAVKNHGFQFQVGYGFKF